MITIQIIESINSATAKALATQGPAGLNVVPVSVIKIVNDQIWLFDFFMNKTAENLKNDASEIALTCWNGMSGIQIKATAIYLATGDQYDAAKRQMLVEFPDRTLKGLIILTPSKYYDISPGKETTGQEICN